MVQKGLMDVGASNEDLRLLLNTGKSTGKGGAKSQSNRTGDGQPKVRNQGKDITSNPSTSKMTIYRKAVQTIAPEINGEIEAYLNRVRTQTVESDTSQKISSSSDELMDVSDENVSGKLQVQTRHTCKSEHNVKWNVKLFLILMLIYISHFGTNFNFGS